MNGGRISIIKNEKILSRNRMTTKVKGNSSKNSSSSKKCRVCDGEPICLELMDSYPLCNKHKLRYTKDETN